MSRCFPYPQPGYEKKPRDLSITLCKDLKREKEKKKKKKKKRDKDDKKKRSSEERGRKTGNEKGGEDESRAKRRREGKNGDRTSGDVEAVAKLNSGTGKVRRNGEFHLEDYGLVEAHLGEAQAPSAAGGGEGPSVSGRPADFADIEDDGSPGDAQWHFDSGGKGEVGVVMPVQPTDEPPGVQVANAELEDDNWWLFRSRGRPPKAPSLADSHGSKPGSATGLALDKESLRGARLAVAKPLYLPEFDVCIMPYIPPF